MPLTLEQQLILHAWVDGECSSAEASIAAELLESPQTSLEARAYLRDVRRLRQIVAGCCEVRAPHGLHTRILAAVNVDHRGRVYRPRFGAMLTAAAAALLIGVGVAFGSGTFTSDAPAHPQLATEFPASSTRGETGRHQSAPVPKPEPTIVSQLPPQLPRQPDGGPGDAAEPDAPRTSVRLDRGAEDAPCEILVDFARTGGNTVNQVYSDLMMLAALHGEAELVESRPDPDFPGHDFGQYECVRLSVSERRLPELLYSVNAMTTSQNYGLLWIPADLRQTADVVAARAEVLCQTKAGKPTLRNWMPLALQAAAGRGEEAPAINEAGKLGRWPESDYAGLPGSDRKMLIYIKLR
ncbi:MAG: hypothetical protein IT464_07110 [Planctomycetes bacterium]|nr:hypothetical protein [Planctomycetota bacterium]